MREKINFGAKVWMKEIMNSRPELKNQFSREFELCGKWDLGAITYDQAATAMVDKAHDLPLNKELIRAMRHGFVPSWVTAIMHESMFQYDRADYQKNKMTYDFMFAVALLTATEIHQFMSWNVKDQFEIFEVISTIYGVINRILDVVGGFDPELID